MEIKLNTIEEALEELKNGRVIIVVDDEDRENEGDFLTAARNATPEIVNFMATHGRGLICAPLSEERCDQLGLEMMVRNNSAAYETPFTVSIDLIGHGCTTGISASDRSKTILALINPETRPEELGKPGHIFPLRARKGGVLRRAGHTEAAIDLCKLSQHEEVAVICEIINDDGSMARMDDLIEFAKKHDLKIGTIRDLIQHKLDLSNPVEFISKSVVPTEFGEFEAHVYKDNVDGTEHIAMTYGDFISNSPSMVRVHSECLTGDTLFSTKCDCGSQLSNALKKIVENESGVLLYIRGHEGRGIGLGNKIKAYSLQDQGEDTVDANLKLGFKKDQRDYGTGALILRSLGITQMNLLTNNPEKRAGLLGYGLEIVKRTPLIGTTTPENIKYLETKQTRMGHNFNDE